MLSHLHCVVVIPKKGDGKTLRSLTCKAQTVQVKKKLIARVLTRSYHRANFHKDATAT